MNRNYGTHMHALETHKLTRDYLGQYGDLEKIVLERCLLGWPDTVKSHQAFVITEMVPVAYKGRIFSRQELLDFYLLMQMQPGIEREILHCPIGLYNLPPLDVVIKTPKLLFD